MRHRFVSAIIVLLIGLSAQSAPLREGLVVMVDASFGPGRPTDHGAGLVMSQTAARTVIVTARHVVQNESGDIAPHVSVEFHQLRGRMYPASATAAYIDVNLDLAVLFVDHAPSASAPSVLTPDALKQISPTPRAQLAGATVQVVGAMGGRRWASGPAGDTVLSANADVVRVKSEIARAGASGGGLFDRNGNVIAMNSRLDTSSGRPQLESIPMQLLVRRLKQWGIETMLEEADSSSSEPELARQVQQGLRLVVDPPDPAGRERPGRNHQLNVRAVLSPAVASLQPTVEVTFPLLGDAGGGRILVLRPPLYVGSLGYPAQLESHATLVLPDGRRIGPVVGTLDLLTPLRQWARSGSAQDIQRLEDQHRFFVWNQEELRKARERGAQAASQSEAQSARNAGSGFREQLPKVFGSWGIRCKKESDAWVCGRAGYFPVFPAGGRATDIFQSIAIGGSEQDLSIELPLDPTVDLGAEMPRNVAALLTQGSSQVFVRVRLADGQVLGPKVLCEVKERRPTSQRPMECLRR